LAIMFLQFVISILTNRGQEIISEVRISENLKSDKTFTEWGVAQAFVQYPFDGRNQQSVPIQPVFSNKVGELVAAQFQQGLSRVAVTSQEESLVRGLSGLNVVFQELVVEAIREELRVKANDESRNSLPTITLSAGDVTSVEVPLVELRRWIQRHVGGAKFITISIQRINNELQASAKMNERIWTIGESDLNTVAKEIDNTKRLKNLPKATSETKSDIAGRSERLMRGLAFQRVIDDEGKLSLRGNLFAMNYLYYLGLTKTASFLSDPSRTALATDAVLYLESAIAILLRLNSSDPELQRRLIYASFLALLLEGSDPKSSDRDCTEFGPAGNSGTYWAARVTHYRNLTSSTSKFLSRFKDFSVDEYRMLLSLRLGNALMCSGLFAPAQAAYDRAKGQLNSFGKDAKWNSLFAYLYERIGTAELLDKDESTDPIFTWTAATSATLPDDDGTEKPNRNRYDLTYIPAYLRRMDYYLCRILKTPKSRFLMDKINPCNNFPEVSYSEVTTTSVKKAEQVLTELFRNNTSDANPIPSELKVLSASRRILLYEEIVRYEKTDRNLIDPAQRQCLLIKLADTTLALKDWVFTQPQLAEDFDSILQGLKSLITDLDGDFSRLPDMQDKKISSLVQGNELEYLPQYQRSCFD
ncbi:MAG: hypothetical protein SFU83_07165, partial [Meiothermus sp.]|nr:hypothetical protein [Meiothermus sp.]